MNLIKALETVAGWVEFSTLDTLPYFLDEAGSAHTARDILRIAADVLRQLPEGAEMKVGALMRAVVDRDRSGASQVIMTRGQLSQLCAAMAEMRWFDASRDAAHSRTVLDVPIVHLGRGAILVPPSARIVP